MADQPHPLDYAGHAGAVRIPATRRRRRWWVEVLDALWVMPVWSVFAYLVIAVPVGAMIALAGPLLVYPILVLAVLLIPAAAVSARSIRRRRAASVLGYLQQAFRLNLPVERFLGAAAHSEAHPLSRRLRRLRSLLEGGSTLAGGLALAVPELPTRAVAMIDHAEREGNLPRVLDRLVGELVTASRQMRQDRVLEIWYPPLLLLVLGVLIYGMDILLGSRYYGIFIDFHMKIPPLTEWLLNAMDWLWPAFIALLCIFLFACGMKLREAIYIARPSWLWREIKARLLWCVPLVHGVLYDRSLADLCTGLADSVESARPIDNALVRAGQLELHPFVRRRLSRWMQGLSAGRPIDAAARSAGFPALLAGMMNPAAGASLDNALRFLARFYADRSLVRREVACGIYLPLVTIGMGVVVATVAIGLFLPLQRLVMQLGRY